MAVTKGIVLVCGLIVFFLLKNSAARGIGSVSRNKCIYDRSIELYNNSNYVLRKSENQLVKQVLMILSSELIDLIFLSLCVIW